MEDTTKETKKITVPSSELPCVWYEMPGSAIREYRYDKDLKSLDVIYAHSRTALRYLQVPAALVDEFRLSERKADFVMLELESFYKMIELEPSEVIGEVA